MLLLMLSFNVRMYDDSASEHIGRAQAVWKGIIINPRR